jgi:DNA-binding NtrC family response regulator
VQDYAGTENILFVDDEKSIRNLGHDCLERFGYIVTAVSDGQKAMEVFAANPDRFNLVVTDQTMPNMTGEKLASALLKLRPDIPIIICTGHSPITTPESSKASGISAFLQKPLAPTQLMRVVREVLDQAKNSV